MCGRQDCTENCEQRAADHEPKGSPRKRTAPVTNSELAQQQERRLQYRREGQLGPGTY